jgi:hypothetical protein
MAYIYTGKDGEECLFTDQQAKVIMRLMKDNVDLTITIMRLEGRILESGLKLSKSN